MTTISVRTWFWLLLIAVVGVPAITTVTFSLLRTPPPQTAGWGYLEATLRPGLAAEILENIARWRNPAWQEQFRRQTEPLGLGLVLMQPEDRVVYRSSPSSFAADHVVPAADSQAPPANLGGQDRSRGARGPGEPAFALVYLDPERAVAMVPPVARWVDFEFLRIPIAQMVALLVIVAAVALFVSRSFLQPLAHLVGAMRQVEAGNLDVATPRSRVTEVASAASAFSAMTAALRASLERQEELEQERRMVISAVVHDLRTPLFSLGGYLDGLSSGLADTAEKRARYLQVAQDKVEALRRLVADLSAYTRTEYLEEVPASTRLDFGELLIRIAEALLPQAAAKGVDLQLVRPDQVCVVRGDTHPLTRAIENVLDNAIRYTPAGVWVRVSWEPRASGVTFQVADSGPGIAAVDLPNIFTPMYRGEASRNRRTGGTGLGLAVARRLLRAHGGDLSARNATAQGGAVFVGTLPRASGTSEPPAPPASRADAS